MKANSADALRHAARMEEVLALVRAKVTPENRGPLEAFVAAYYGQVDPEDLAARDAADLYGAALSHWSFARKREPGRARVRVFNPTLEEHGWQSTHTIIEIVNDDMPFLVDSVTMEVNRHGLTLHLIVHPIIAVVRGPDGAADRPCGRGRGARHARVVHPCRGRPDRRCGTARSPGRRHRARAAGRAPRVRRLDGDAGAPARHRRGTGAARSRRFRPANWARGARSCAGLPTITSRSWATAGTTSWPSTARTRSGSSPGRAWASCAKARRRTCP